MKSCLIGIVLVMGVLTSGCVGPMFEGTIFEAPPKKDLEVARIATNTQQMSVEFRQLSEQMMELNRNQALLESRLSRMDAQLGTMPASQEEITALRRDVQLIRAERETLKKEITEDLVGRIERISAKQKAEVTSARTTAPIKTGASATATATGRGGYEHKVESGQTLSVIARGYGKSLDVIMKANRITNPSVIRVGQVLFIPD